MADNLYWPRPKGFELDKIRNVVQAWNEIGFYAADYDKEGDRIVLTRTGIPLRYFEPVEVQPGDGGWVLVRKALEETRLYKPTHYKADRAMESAKALAELDPAAGAPAMAEWLDHLHWAIAMSPREQVLAVGPWMDAEFGRRFGPHQTMAYLRTWPGFASFQIAEVTPRFELMEASTVTAMISQPKPPDLMAEGAFSHGNTNYFAIPMGIAYPHWLGGIVRGLPLVAIFVLDEPKVLPYTDLVHRDIWDSWVGAWHENDTGPWQPLVPARPAAFIRWYVERLNELLERLCDFATTARAVTGEIAPLRQIALTRSVFQLQDVIGRMLTTSDPFARTTWAMLALGRFEELGWGYDLLANPDAMSALMAPLEADPEIGGMFGTYGRQLWARVMTRILDNAAGTLSPDKTSITLASGETMSTKRYASGYLKAVRNTLHRFSPEAMSDVFGLHAGVMPIDLSQLVAMLWLRALVDPVPLMRPFRA